VKGCARSELKKELEMELEQLLLLLLLAAAGTDKTKLQQTQHYFIESNRCQLKLQSWVVLRISSAPTTTTTTSSMFQCAL